jgi:apolipoprotein N-acyltransferase
MRGIPWRLLAAGTLTAVLLDLPFPLAGPLPAWRTVFAWFALVPLLVALLGLPVYSPGHRRRWYLVWSFLGGWLCGTLWFGANCYWVYGTMHTYAGMSAALAMVCLVLFSLFLGFWFGVFGLALEMMRLATFEKRFTWVGLAAVPVLWVAMEFALARVPYFPWDLLGYSQVDNGLLTRLAPWTGVYGISFLVAGVNALFAAGVVFRRRSWMISRSMLAVAFSGNAWSAYGLVVVLLAYLGFADRPYSPATEATAVLVQPNLNVATDDVWVGPEWDRQIAQFARLGAQTCGSYLAGIPETGAQQWIPRCGVYDNLAPGAPPKPTLIVWPESPAPFRDLDPRFRSAMSAIARADHAPIIVGNVGMDVDAVSKEYEVYNSASVVAAGGEFVGRYDKMHLVPFGEYIPYRHLLFFAKQVTQTLADMNTGSERKVFRIASAQDGGHRYGVFICYESVFGDEVRQFVRLGAEVLVNISDDGWYGDTSAPWQHLNMARMRAIENRRWILRDTNNGTTASIDPYGTVRQSIPRHAVGALAAGFGYSSEVTFYTAHGDWLPALCAIVALGIVGWATRALLYR